MTQNIQTDTFEINQQYKKSEINNSRNISPLHQYFKKKSQFSIKTMQNIQKNLAKSLSNKENSLKIAKLISKSGSDLKTSIKMSGFSQNDCVIQQNQSNLSSQPSIGSFNKSSISYCNFLQIKNIPIEELYDLKQSLGQGGYGKVYRAICRKTGQQRAVKQLKMHKLSSKKKKQMLAEFTLMKKINHPNIITLYDLIEYNNHMFVIMQYCKGGELLKNINLIRKKSQQIIANILAQIISALNYIHSLNIVHRDIKLQNIVCLNNISQVINQNNVTIKIIDFGVSIQAKYKIVTNVPPVGTVSYMAPQMYRKILTTKSDIWATAVLIAILLTGKSPIKGQTNHEIINNILVYQFDPKSPQFQKISPEAKDLLSKMLQKNFHKRINISDIMKHPFLTKSMQHALISESDMAQISKLQKFERRNNFVTVIQTYLSLKKANQKQRERMSRLFKSIDQDNSGLIDKYQIIKFFKDNSLFYNEEQLIHNLNQIDLDKSGKIDFGQFIVAMAQKQSLYGKQQLIEVFNYFDKDNTGYLDKKQLKILLIGCDAKQIEFYLKQLDLDHDERISRQQFINYLTKN